jgi:hypothetical protein
VRAKYDFVVADYVVMPEHFHLLIHRNPVKRSRGFSGVVAVEQLSRLLDRRNRQSEYRKLKTVKRSAT